VLTREQTTDRGLLAEYGRLDDGDQNDDHDQPEQDQQ
jgi:hypothetical protein